jgi:DNA polymerase I-like protein with 3'-5' exonuclease and polymerase domains/uracil-DNA glycosylase
MDRLKTRVVGPEGPLTAQICFIGQAPGAEEDSSGRPFVGAAGQLFDRGLKAIGILRSETLVWNIFAQRPPNNDVGYYYQHYPTQLTWEGEEHLARLKVWLEGLLKDRNAGMQRPNILVALGAESMYHLTGQLKITKYRGSLVPCTLVPGFKVYIMFHPSYVNRLMNEPEERLQGQKKTQRQNALPLFLIDLERVKHQAASPFLHKVEREFKVIGEIEEVVRCLQDIRPPRVSVDIETIQTAIGPVIWCIGFANSPAVAFTIPLIKRGYLVWSAQEEAIIWNEISKIFLDLRIEKDFQNGGFDLVILGRYYGLRVANGSYGDTMWMHQAAFPYLSKGLDLLCSIYTLEPYYKEDGKYWDGRRISDEAEFLYNCKDCVVQYEVQFSTERRAKANGTWGTYLRHIKVMPSLMEMMIRGVRIDIEKKERLSKEFRVKATEAKTIVNELAKAEVNPGSPDQLQRLLYGYLGLPIQYNHKTKKPTTDKDAIGRLRKKVSHDSDEGQILKGISDYRKFEKLASTYTDLEVGDDGRIRTSYGFVSTFRLSSSESVFGGGGNLQNIPVHSEEGRMIRELFIPDPGFVMLARDLEKAEAMFIAWDAEDLEAMEAFTSGVDVHWENAKKILALPKDTPYHKAEYFLVPLFNEEKEMYILRQIGKTVEYADSYGMGPMMLQNILIRDEIQLELNVCKRLLEQRHHARPMVVRWQANIRNQVRATRSLENALGDKREFHGRLNDNLFRSAYSFRPQSTVGRITELCIQSLHEHSNVFIPLLNVHDEVVGQCRKDDVPQAISDGNTAANIPLTLNNRTLVIPGSYKIGPSWGELKEIKL